MLLSYPDRHCVGFFLCRLVKPKPLLDFVKTQLEATNPAVKKAAVEILVTMRKQLGPDVRGMLSDVKPALLTTIDEAFSKVHGDQFVAVYVRKLKAAIISRCHAFICI